MKQSFSNFLLLDRAAMKHVKGGGSQLPEVCFGRVPYIVKQDCLNICPQPCQCRPMLAGEWRCIP